MAGRLPGGLLLRLGSKSPGLRPKLDEDVFHAREVCFGLGELLLRLPASPVVTPDPGHFLEQRSALLRSQREGLVDHALADEQERIVGKVRAVEQIDEVLQPDPLAVQQVVALAGTVEAAAQLEDRVIDRQQRVGVVENEGDVRHSQGGARLGSGEDHVLRLPGPQRTTLFAERPAQRVGKV